MSFSIKNGIYLPTSHATSISSNVAKIGTLSIWAHNGIICLSRELPDGKQDFKQQSIFQALDTAEALSDELKEMRKQDRPDYNAIKLQQRFVDELLKVIDRAKEQGPPQSADIVRDKINRRRKVVSMPVSSAEFTSMETKKEKGLNPDD